LRRISWKPAKVLRRGSTLGTGLREPAIGHFVVERGRLVAGALAAADGAEQVVLRAPAGSGKTVLLAQLAAGLRERGDMVAWLGLEPADNDAGHLLTRLVAAVADGAARAAVPADDELARLATPPRDPVDAGYLRLLADALPADSPVWLLLDDVHALSPGRAADGLARLLDTAGPRLRTVLACRSGPPLPLAGRIVDGRAVELDGAELAFGPAEARALLAAHDLRLDDDLVAQLLERTEGWAAGLRLAALSLAQSDDAAGFVASFGGDRRQVADYLVSEVLRGLPPYVTDFMLATSAPAELSVELAAVLSGRADAGAILDRLAGSNVLTTRSDTAPPTYRYHALLRGYLAGRAQARDLASFRTGHSAAAAYFDRRGLPTAALAHAARGQDWPLLTDLLHRHGLPLVLRGRGSDVAAALDLLPPAARIDPQVTLLGALLAMADGQVAAGLAAVDALPDLSAQPRTAALAHAVRLYGAQLTGAHGAALQALLDGPALNDGSVEAVLLQAMRGMSRLDAEDVPRAEAEIGPATRAALAQGYDFLALRCMIRLSATAAERGRPEEMVRRAEEAIGFAAERGWERTAVLAPTYFAAAWGAWGLLDDELTEQNLSAAEGLAADAEPRFAMFIALLRAYVSGERSGSAAELARRVRTAWAATDETILGRHGMSPLCMVDLAYADAGRDGDWMRETVARAERRLPGTGDLEVVRAWRLLAGDRPVEARTTLEPVLDGRLATDVRALLYGWQLECRAATTLGRGVRAHEALLAMLEVATVGRLVRPVVLAAPVVHEMLRDGRGRFGASEEFVGQVLQAVRSRPAPGADPVDLPALTERETTILRDLPSLLSLQGIADAHHVSENTVKTHVRSIYDKLGVHTRREAVRRAEELGLLQ
jgi:LuxR family transcriptional regulator, maltose regulon positive regulatory protein